MSWYASLSRGKQIAFSVFLTHGILLVMLGVDHWMHRTNVQRKKVTVNTIVLAAPPKVVTSSAPKTAAATPKKPTPKPQVKKQPIAKKTEEFLLKEIEQNFESLSNVAPLPKKSDIVVPTLALQFQEQPQEYSATEQIASMLQNALELPEFGEVKIKLQIGRLGTLDNIEILEARSQKNAEFLKKRLPELGFPCLNEVTTLTIVFSNAL